MFQVNGYTFCYHRSPVIRKPVFGISDVYDMVGALTFQTETRGMRLSMQQTTNVLTEPLLIFPVRPKIKNSLFGIADRLTCFAATQIFFSKSEIFLIIFTISVHVQIVNI